MQCTSVTQRQILIARTSGSPKSLTCVYCPFIRLFLKLTVSISLVFIFRRSNLLITIYHNALQKFLFSIFFLNNLKSIVGLRQAEFAQQQTTLLVAWSNQKVPTRTWCSNGVNLSRSKAHVKKYQDGDFNASKLKTFWKNEKWLTLLVINFNLVFLVDQYQKEDESYFCFNLRWIISVQYIYTVWDFSCWENVVFSQLQPHLL